jgi:hypothetical protein
MSKIEKTLELNITHEILSLTDSFWWFLLPHPIREEWKPYIRIPFIRRQRLYATGLPIHLEGKAGGGYDVCIHAPAKSPGIPPRLLFMQFKAGVERKYSEEPRSQFRGSKKNHNLHVEFEINNNTQKNQHQLLQYLAENAGNKNAVFYVFPRIVDEQQLIANNGRLLRKTSFISVEEIDKIAKNNNVTINDGKVHKFRTCYKDHTRNEVCSTPFNFGKPENPGGLLGEILSIRMYRSIYDFLSIKNIDAESRKKIIQEAMYWHILNIGVHFSISNFILVETIRKYSGPTRTRFIEFDRHYPIPDDFEYLEENQKIYLEEVFNGILQSMSPYFEWINTSKTLTLKKIPQPPSNYSIEMKPEGIRFNVDSAKDLKGITYWQL